MSQKDQIIEMINNYFEGQLTEINEFAAVYKEVEVKCNKIKKGSLKTLIMHYTDDFGITKEKLKIKD